MSKKDLQKEKIERAGRRLLEAGHMPGAEIEKIVAAPHLFDSVKARIKAEQSQQKKAKSFFPVWNFQTAAGAFAVLIVLSAFAAVIFVKTQSSPQVIAEINKPVIAVPDETPAIPEITETNIQPAKNQAVVRKADFKAETPKPVTREQNINPPKTAQVQKKEQKKEPKQVFYPLAFGRWEADGEDLQIIRAELSRSELFALGVNLPVENESARVKTDLLVGSDGVARAIRFVE